MALLNVGLMVNFELALIFQIIRRAFLLLFSRSSSLGVFM